MQGANGRQYKREMASFEVGSEDASTMARIGLEGRAQARSGRQRGSNKGIEMERGKDRIVGVPQENGERNEICHVRNGDDSFVCLAVCFISDESNSIAPKYYIGDRTTVFAL